MALIELATSDEEISAQPGDHLVVRLPEQGGTGYVWMVDELPAGTSTVGDAVEFDHPLSPGGTQLRRLEIALGMSGGRLVIVKRRPWEEGAGVERVVTEVVVGEGTG